VKACFFTTVFDFSHTDLENWLIRFNFPLNCNNPIPDNKCSAELQKRGVWIVYPIQWQPPEVDIKEDQHVVPENEQRQWIPPYHFQFLSTECESSTWFIPSVPIEPNIALIAHSTPYPPYDLEILCGRTLPIQDSSYHFCKIKKVPEILLDIDRKFISPGCVSFEKSNSFALAHTASSMMSSSGAPIIPIGDHTSPVPFYGIHVGTIHTKMLWNYALNVKCKAFLLKWYTCVFPHIKNEVSFLSIEKKHQLKDYLHQILNIVNSNEDLKNDVTSAIFLCN